MSITSHRPGNPTEPVVRIRSRARLIVGCILGCAVLGSTLTPDSVSADERKQSAGKTRPVKVWIIIRGLQSDADVQVIRTALKARQDIRIDLDQITPGERPRYFSEPVAAEILNPKETNIGSLAATIGNAKTPFRREMPPKCNLVLFTSDVIDEPRVEALRGSLSSVNGLEVQANGGLGALIKQDLYWVQLENAGGAGLDEILKAAEQGGCRVTISKPN